jgi:hypothetical protein
MTLASKSFDVAPQCRATDRDKHGCVGSNGFAWCSRKNACVRPWELGRKMGFDLVGDGFDRFCSSRSQQNCQQRLNVHGNEE